MPSRPEKGQKSLSGKNWKELLAAYLQAKDLKQSESRNRIVEVLLEEPGHFNVQELVRKVQAAYPGIGVATIYRNLPVLQGCGLITEALTGEGGEKIYEVASSPFSEGDAHHDRIVCLDCDRIFEISAPFMEWYGNTVSSKLGLTPVSQRLQVSARCETLRLTGACPRRAS